MRILLVGSGGREHALAWSISASVLVEELVMAPGSAAMAEYGRCEDVDAGDVEAIVALAIRIAPDLVVVGPEAPLVAGVVDRLEGVGIKAFGPTQAAARLEGSKAFARATCARLGIAQPHFTACDTMEEARDAIRSAGGACVVKADGLAAGKGVVVADNAEQAMEAAREMFEGRFGAAGATVLIEERITGPEASLFALVDGRDTLFMGSAQDHKRVNDGDTGPNTGGMGAVSPAPRLTPALQETVMRETVDVLARGMAEDGTPYRGVLYVGLMLSKNGPRVIEFNCRLGDPEAQVILPRLKSDLLAAMFAATEGELGHVDLRWDERAAVAVVMASQGYPGPYNKGYAIGGLPLLDTMGDVLLFHAGTSLDDAGVYRSDGGRVLSVTGLGDDIAAARDAAYRGVDVIDWPQGFCRRDIAAI